MYLFFDTETTGLSHHKDHIVQIAWVLVDEVGNIKTEECYVIRPDGYSIPTKASQIHGITTAKACEIGQPLAFALKRLSDVATRATVLVAHNFAFDFAILQHDYKIAGLAFPLHGKIQICTMKLSTAWCRLPKLNGSHGFKWPKLDELHYRLFGEGFDGTHDALADTQACMRCYFELVKKAVITPPIKAHTKPVPHAPKAVASASVSSIKTHAKQVPHTPKVVASTPASRSQLAGDLTWLWWVVAVIVVAVFMSSGKETKRPKYQPTQIPAPAQATVQIPVPVPVQIPTPVPEQNQSAIDRAYQRDQTGSANSMSISSNANHKTDKFHPNIKLHNDARPSETETALSLHERLERAADIEKAVRMERTAKLEQDMAKKEMVKKDDQAEKIQEEEKLKNNMEWLKKEKEDYRSRSF